MNIGSIRDLENLENWLATNHPEIPHRSNFANDLESAHNNLSCYVGEEIPYTCNWWRGYIKGMIKALQTLEMISAEEAWMLIGMLTDVEEEERPAGGRSAVQDVVKTSRLIAKHVRQAGL